MGLAGTQRWRIAQRIRWWWVVFATVAVLVAVGITLGLLLPHTTSKQQQIEVVRTALAAGAGVGAAITVLLAFRRQQHHEEATERIDHDASERRITELYTKAVEQLGSDKAPVRLGGLYALERLGQSAAAHRQTIVDVICAYLRMPYSAPADSDDPNDERRQELQVRKTAERILKLHLCDSRLPIDDGETIAADDAFWEDIRVDLSHATVLTGAFSKFHPSEADFAYAAFTSDTSFEDAVFTRKASFDGASFTGKAEFFRTAFKGQTTFDGAVFTGIAIFLRATFSLGVSFKEATFASKVAFDQARVGREAWFDHATLARCSFENTTFFDRARFEKATFTDLTWFRKVKFAGEVSFYDAGFEGAADFTDARFKGKAHFDKVMFGGRSSFYLSQFASAAVFTDARFKGNAIFHSARFAEGASLNDAKALMAMPGGTAACRWPSGWEVQPAADGWATCTGPAPVASAQVPDAE
ncbi:MULTISPECIES: pentapeptide repeat-containing protein [unclassified Streptomyces]|uniref:pentapeptide repeat-containing protein n=1 Tax=unclassified Streptomyces TaxID=2593676 RepID=UPI000708AB7C|nr:pentapeptide repeat-containing protein [Streptomyces sp. Root264]KRD23365.1 hypothetical protein ASE41_10275 [Streptomyces sp. Root264]